MAESIQTAFMLFGVGMVTVFIILAGVIGTGSTLIKIVNSFSKEPISIPPNISPRTNVNAKKVAVLTAVVEEVTRGRGRVEKIEKL